MARQNINFGATANDGTGDPLRNAMQKSNENFIEIYETVSAANVGGVGPGVSVTSPAWNMPTDGTGDCSVILQNMVNAGIKVIFFPTGTYNFPTVVNLPAETKLIGSGWQNCKIIAGGAWWVICWRSILDGQTTDWTRCTITDFWVHMAAGGIRFWGHEMNMHNMKFSGGGAHMDLNDATTWIADPNAWCVEGIAANECHITRLTGGYGGNNAINTLFANGLRLTALNVNSTQDLANYWPTAPAAGQAQRTVNYGDSLIEEIAFKGRCKNWIGLHIGHESRSLGVQNMIHVNRAQLQAADVPSILFGNTDYAVPVSTGLYAWKGSIGVQLKRCRRNIFTAVNTETSEVAWDFIGNYRYDDSDDITPTQTITTERNTFIMCPTMNSVTNYRDSNDTITGSVKDNHFQNGQSFGPLQPTGIATASAEGGFDIKAGMFDTYLQGQLWFNRTQTGLPDAWMRFSPSQDFMIGVVGNPDPGNALEDSHPRNDHPRRALGFRTTFENEAQIFLPMAAEQGRDARLKLGNGEDDESSGPLQAIVMADPVRMPAKTTLPSLTGQASRGTIIHADNQTAMGGGTVSRYSGPGLYSYRDQNTAVSAFNGTFIPLDSPIGYMESNIGRSGDAYTVDVEWFGRLSQHGHGSTVQNITVPAGLILEKETYSGKVPRPSRTFWVSNLGTAQVKVSGAGNVTLYHADVSANALEIPQYKTYQCIYTRVGASDWRLFFIG